MIERRTIVYVLRPKPEDPPAPQPRRLNIMDKVVMAAFIAIALLIAFQIGVHEGSPSPANPPVHPAASNQMPPGPPVGVSR